MPQFANLFTSRQEQLIPVEGNVKGVIPTWVEGRLLRVGPAIFDMDDFSLNHFLDGFAMLSKFEIKNGKISYSQKILESEAYEKFRICRRPILAEFGTHAYPDTTKGFLHRMFSTLVPTDLTDNNIVALYQIEEEVITASLTCFVHSIDADSLVKKERHDLMKSSSVMFCTAHPLRDADGALWNVGATMLTGCKYHVFRIPFIGSGKTEDALKGSKIVATVPSSWKTCLSFINSFVMTENYVIFMEQPLLINCMKLAQIGIKGKALSDTFEWTPTEKNRFIVVEKETGNVIKTRFFAEDPPFFVLHHINAFEKDDQVVVDLIGYRSSEVLDNYQISKLRNNEFNNEHQSQSYRFVIPLIHFVIDINEGENLVTVPDTSAKAIRQGDAIILSPQLISDPGPEFPVINVRFRGQEYKYFYATGMFGNSKFKNSICKVNVETNAVDLYKLGEEEFCGEPVFIPKLDTTADEDDGIVMVAVSCNDNQKPDYLAVLDSKTFQELGRVEFETKFMQALHGTFIWSQK